MMLRRTLLAVVLSAMTSLPVVAQSGLVEFDQANNAYSAGDFEKAVAGYSAIIKHQGYSSSVLYNLANAYFEQGEVGEAVLHYERALRLDPANPDILTNLKHVREEAGLPQPAQRWWQATLSSMTPSGWAWTASVLLFLFLITAFVRWFVSSLGRYVRTWRLVQALLIFGLFLSIAAAAMTSQHRNVAVILAADAPVLASPFEQADKIYTLTEGRTVDIDKIDKQYGSFVRVRYDRDKLGWVHLDGIAPVDPGLLSGS